MSGWISDKQYRAEVGRLANPRIKKQAKAYGLTQSEQVAIGHYAGTGYSGLNAALWKDGGREDVTLGGAASVLRGALRKLPNYQGKVMRRTRPLDHFLAEHSVGVVVDHRAFISSTFGSKDVMGGQPHRLVIHGFTGKKIDWISHYKREESEVLFNSPTRFLVTNRKILPDGVVEIKLMEVPNE